MLNEEETDQTGRESLQEPITANGSQLSTQAAAAATLSTRKGDGERGKVMEAKEERQHGRYGKGTEKKGKRG